jgi:hypothetical protein
MAYHFDNLELCKKYYINWSTQHSYGRTRCYYYEHSTDKPSWFYAGPILGNIILAVQESSFTLHIRKRAIVTSKAGTSKRTEFYVKFSNGFELFVPLIILPVSTLDNGTYFMKGAFILKEKQLFCLLKKTIFVTTFKNSAILQQIGKLVICKNGELYPFIPPLKFLFNHQELKTPNVDVTVQKPEFSEPEFDHQNIDSDNDSIANGKYWREFPVPCSEHQDSDSDSDSDNNSDNNSNTTGKDWRNTTGKDWRNTTGKDWRDTTGKDWREHDPTKMWASKYLI